MTGPNSLPTLPLPQRWAANSPVRMVAAIGTTNGARPGSVTVIPSTAERTEMAGVMTESP